MSYTLSPRAPDAATETSAATPPAAPQKPPLDFRAVDIVCALLTLALGFLFWEWSTPRFVAGTDTLVFPGLGVTLFFLAAVCLCAVWMRIRGIRQNAKSLVTLAAVIAGALPFTLYDTLPVYLALFGFEIIVCLLWVCFSCGSEITTRLSGFVIFDVINQAFIVPFANIFTPVAALRHSFRNRAASKNKRLAPAIIGVIVALPVIALVIQLLVASDSGFNIMLDKLFDFADLPQMRRFVWEAILGIPVAFFIFGLVFGNASKRHTEMITSEHAHNFVDKAHRIAPAAVYAPLILLNALYLLFFAAMTTYLVSGFGHRLPAGYDTYAEYARRGFFELCFVAAINLFALGFAWMLSKRAASGHPKPLRIIGGTLTALTLLLIATAASKMLLYVDMYGLSRLRLYTLWFMLVLACVFIALLIWHIHTFNAGKPIVIICAVLFLALVLSNTDGIIAKHNVKSYLSGKTETVDVFMLNDLSDAAVPAMKELGEKAPDKLIRAEAHNLLAQRMSEVSVVRSRDLPVMSFNLQSAEARALLNRR
ncbi:MAG: DUF4173 domain-containing protein [Clostridiales Family XIII bacterium]|jgi:hypothetical protein|nr:DUF4173 domain-containing protein [Clostridiales Family XIII bacterium]